jgi:hypothetical protein
MDIAQMTKPEPAAAAPQSAPGSMPMACCPQFLPIQSPRGALGSWIGNRYVLTIALAVVGLMVVGSGLALGWGWLTAVGVAPLMVSVAPCLVMCAVCLGVMCRNSQGGAIPSAPPTGAPPPASEG